MPTPSPLRGLSRNQASPRTTSPGRSHFALFVAGAGLATMVSAAPPIVEFKMDQGSGTQVANTGSAGGSASILGAKPTWTSNAPVNGGAAALDFGATNAIGHVVHMDQTPQALKGLKSFTLSGWLNLRSGATSTGGGNRILSFMTPGGVKGVELAYQSDASLQLGVDQWNDHGPARSNGGKFSANANAPYNNWVFFAVTYNSFLASNHVTFYFGNNTTIAQKDVSISYSRGPVDDVGYSLSVGHMNGDNRYAGADQMFRGLIDQIRIHGSATDGSGALSQADIAQIQNAAPIAGQGVLYEEWTGVSGTTIANLLASPNFPNNPSATLVRPAFESFQNRNDNYGMRMSGWVKAPETGDYTFWLSSDDAGELRVSADANPVNAARIASVSTFTGWDVWSSPGTMQFEAGKFYYLEALSKDGVGDDHLRVKWRLPSGSTETPIPQSRMYLRPDNGDALFPSSVNLYEPGTSNIKATLGWHKEEGENHLFLKTENFPKMTIFNDIINLPAKKLFLGDKEDAYGFGLRYDPGSGNVLPTLTVQAKADQQWAMKFSHMGPALTPITEINNGVLFSGPGLPGETAFGYLDYLGGLTVTHDLQGSQGFSNRSANVSAESFILTEAVTGETNASTVYAGVAEFSTTAEGQPPSVTRIEGGVVSADEVRTKAWRIPPDYVFEKGYPVRSLEEVERFVRKHKHLPEIPSAREMQKNGIAMGDMHMRMLKTMEELTLNLIALNKDVKAQQARNVELEKEIRALKRAQEGAEK